MYKSILNGRLAASVLLIITLLAIMTFIFVRSSKDSEESAGESGRVVHIVREVAEKINGDYRALSETEKAALSETLSFYVRKAAHFSIFAALGLNACALMLVLPVKKPRFIYPVAFGALYAFSDELHQYFIPGRSMELRDMLIDTAGVILGAASVYAFLFLRNAYLKRAAAKAVKNDG